MFKDIKKLIVLGKICYILSAALMFAVLVSGLLPPNSVLADSQGKVVGSASVLVTTGSCSWTPVKGSLTPGILFLRHASLMINGVTYKTSKTINLAPGSYPYSWKAEAGYIGNGRGELYIRSCASVSVTAGICSWTQATGSLTPVSIVLKFASLTINGMTYKTSRTISLPPGSYSYSWKAIDGHTGNGSGTLVIKGCEPVTAEASVETGDCHWTQADGSLTPVKLDLEHAALTINGKTYTTSQTINLPPGNYPYTWTADNGYIGGGHGKVDIKDCEPEIGKVYVCKYVGTPGVDERLQTGQNPIEVSVNAVPQPVVIGSYFPDAQGRSYVLGFVPMVPEPTRDNCPHPDLPEQASASVKPGQCHWTQADGSLTPVKLDLEHAALTINGKTYTTSQTINLPPGSYPYTWAADNGYIGGGHGKVDIKDCEPEIGKVYVCKYVGTPGVDERLQTGQNPIEVSVNAVPQPVVIGSYFPDAQGRSYVLGFVPMVPEPTRDDCPHPDLPEQASASVKPDQCLWTQADGSLTPVELDLEHAVLTINGKTYTASQTINLPPGNYPYSWTADSGYIGSGSGTVDIGDCTPGLASASTSVGACSWSQETGSLTSMSIDLDHASLMINGKTYTTSQTISLPPGSYPYTWTADKGYTGGGHGKVDIKDCKPEIGKVYVCKYVGTPGVDERLQTGQNPIEVSVNAVPQPVVIGSYFPDAQGRSYVLGFVPMVPEPTRDDCPHPDLPEQASASVDPGQCHWTQADGSLTPVELDLEHAALTINGKTYTASQIIDLKPGSYLYTWAAETGYIGSGSGTLDIGACEPGPASAKVTTGACILNQAFGSLTPVSIELNHAVLTINGLTYVASQTINLTPGSYPYDWTAETGYVGNGGGTVDIAGCAPGIANASVTTGACNWNEAEGSQTSVMLVLSHASLTINNVTYTASQTINLAPGSYPYSWMSDVGYIGNGSGTVDIRDCTPGTASAFLTSGACIWTEESESLTPVTLFLEHASLTINGATYNTSVSNRPGQRALITHSETYGASHTINLPPGNYPYSWSAEPGYIGNGSGTVVIGDCTPGTASASVTIGACSWTQAAGSLTPVTIELKHAVLTINGASYAASHTINLPPGSYSYSWAAENGYTGSGSGKVVIIGCAPGTASVSVTTGTCSWTQAAGSLTPVTIELNYAALTINGATYMTSQTINLAPGSYPYSWSAEAGYIGNGSETIIIGACVPSNANAYISVGVCSWTQGFGSLTILSIDLKHAALTINGETYTTSQAINLAPGSYPYTWTADTGYNGNGSGTVVIGACAPSNATASLSVGVCNWTQVGGSLTPLSLELNHAALMINGATYMTSQTINLPPGSYPYSWTALSGYTGSGSETVVIRDCPLILIPVSGIDRRSLNWILSESLFGPSLEDYIRISIQASRNNLNSTTVVAPTVISDKSRPNADTYGSQSSGLAPDRLFISRINLDVPIVPVGYNIIDSGSQDYDQWLTPNQYAAGWHVTSALLGLPGNTVLNGHHNAYGMVFKDLIKLQIGDGISVYSGSVEFRYQVVANVLLPERFEPLSTRIENARWIAPSQDERITLITCWPQDSNTHRVVIVATRIRNPD